MVTNVSIFSRDSPLHSVKVECKNTQYGGINIRISVLYAPIQVKIFYQNTFDAWF